MVYCHPVIRSILLYITLLHNISLVPRLHLCSNDNVRKEGGGWGVQRVCMWCSGTLTSRSISQLLYISQLERADFCGITRPIERFYQWRQQRRVTECDYFMVFTWVMSKLTVYSPWSWCHGIKCESIPSSLLSFFLLFIAVQGSCTGVLYRGPAQGYLFTFHCCTGAWEWG